MIGIVVLGGVVVVACVVLSRFSLVGSTVPDPPEPSPRQQTDDDGLDAAWRVFGPVAMVGAAGCAVVAASTLLPDPLAIPRAVVAACFIPVLPLIVLSIATFGQMRRDRRNVLDTIESAAPAAWPLAGMLLAAFALVALSGLGGHSGDAQVRNDRRVLVSHGVLTEISSDDYERYESQERRSIAGGTGALYTPSIALGLFAHGRHRQRTTRP